MRCFYKNMNAGLWKILMSLIIPCSPQSTLQKLSHFVRLVLKAFKLYITVLFPSLSGHKRAIEWTQWNHSKNNFQFYSTNPTVCMVKALNLDGRSWNWWWRGWQTSLPCRGDRDMSKRRPPSLLPITKWVSGWPLSNSACDWMKWAGMCTLNQSMVHWMTTPVFHLHSISLSTASRALLLSDDDFTCCTDAPHIIMGFAKDSSDIFKDSDTSKPTWKK